MKLVKLLILLAVISCADNNSAKIEQIILPTELDRPRMENLIRILPMILKQAELFQQQNSSLQLSDQEYNNKFYRSLFENKDTTDILHEIGFVNAEEYEQFYNTMIEMYILLLEKPNSLDSAVANIPNHEKEVGTLLLKYAKEPNNTRLKEKLDRLQYELIVYKNIILVHSFMGYLNSLNQTSK